MTRFYGLLFIFAATSALAQSPVIDPAKLTLDRIFESEDFKEDRHSASKWLETGEVTKLLPSKAHKGASDIVKVSTSGNCEVLVPAERLIPPMAKDPLVVQSYSLSTDLDLVLIYTSSAKVWRQNTRGDYWTFRRSTGKLTKLGSTAKPSTMMFAKLSPDGTRVGYVCENNLCLESVDGGPATKLTNDGSNTVINGTFDWVYEEEFDCRDGWRWSPDGKHIAYWQLDTAGVPNFTLVDNTIAKYPVLKTFAYPKTGERNSACRVGVVAATGGETKWVEVPGDTRTDYYLPRMEWAGNSRELVLRRVNRLQNAVDVMLADAATGQVRTVLHECDAAWVDLHEESLEWIDHGTAFSWLSERDGWRHLYFATRDGSKIRCVTPGAFDVTHVSKIDEKAGRVYYLASPGNPTQRYLYSSPIDGTGLPQRITPADQHGWHDYNFAPDGLSAIHTYSAFDKPPQTDVVSIPEHKVIRTLVTNEKLRDAVGKLAQTPVEFFRTDIGNGIELDGWMMKPPNFDPAKKYPVVFHVYGEPAAQTVVDRWGGSKYLWHLMLTQQGYVVVCVDNRGTPCPRGREWRKCVYRKIGTLAAEEQAAAARAILKQRPYLDASRVGVWGWSGGGSMTLNLLFRSPELFHTGMSVAPVPDMRLYDTIYQERYMGLPQVNADDYQHGSPITHAAGLKGNLLIVHGTGDDNCHYQGVEKLADKLIELNKPFTMMAYPNRSHSINEGKNTSRHLYGLLTRYLNENLPAGPR
ncbi:S9 family peptidase [soil metagenome]